MAISLYQATVTAFLQTLGGVSSFLERGSTHCRDNGIDLAEIVETRLYSDMRPFRFQVLGVAHHSIDAIEGTIQGKFLPSTEIVPAPDYAGLQRIITEARDALQRLTPAVVNGLEGRDVLFQAGGSKIPFTAEGFLMSFSLPNFHFHATTAYNILRSHGVPIGKRDYLGSLRLKN